MGSASPAASRGVSCASAASREGFDVAVVGGGAAAAHAALAVAARRSGARVALVLLAEDRGVGPALAGARRAAAEPAAAAAAAEALPLWADLEARAGGRSFLDASRGALEILPAAHAARWEAAAAEAGVGVSLVTAGRLNEACGGALVVPGSHDGLVDPLGGTLRVAAAARAARELAARAGVAELQGPLEDVDDDGSRFRLRVGGPEPRDIACEQLVVAPAGAALAPLLARFGYDPPLSSGRRTPSARWPARRKADVHARLPTWRVFDRADDFDGPPRERFSVYPGAGGVTVSAATSAGVVAPPDDVVLAELDGELLRAWTVGLGHDRWTDSVCALTCEAPDGEPLFGYVPGVQTGRIVVLGAFGVHAQLLAPLLANGTRELLQLKPAWDAERRFSPEREALVPPDGAHAKGGVGDENERPLAGLSS